MQNPHGEQKQKEPPHYPRRSAARSRIVSGARNQTALLLTVMFEKNLGSEVREVAPDCLFSLNIVGQTAGGFFRYHLFDIQLL